MENNGRVCGSHLHVQYMEVVKAMMQQPQERYGQKRGAELMGEFYLLQSFLAYNDVQEMCSCHRQAWEYMKRPTNLYSLHTAWTFGMPSVVAMFWREKGQLETVLQEVKAGMPLYYRLSEGNGMGAHHAMEGEWNLLKGNEKEALQCFQKALYDAEKLHQDSICYCAWLGMARIAIRKGNVATYVHMQENIDDRPYLGKEASCIFTTDVCKGYLAVLLEQFDDVPDWLWHEAEIQRKTLMPALPYVHSIYGRLLLEQKRKRKISHEAFAEKLQKLIAESRQFHMLLPEVYAWIYLSAGADMTGSGIEAQEYLKKAMELCLDDDMIVPFAENYKLIKHLLDRMLLPRGMQEMKYVIIQKGERCLKGIMGILAALSVTEKTLTLREHEIARLLKERMSVKEIAAKLGISPSTVSNTMQSIYSKLGIHTKRELYYRDDI